MVIKASAASEIRQLIAALGAEDDVRREAAIARLAVLGPRAVDRLIAAYEPADRETRIAILRALESVGDRRLVPVARLALSAGGDLGVAAASALRALLDSPHGSAGTEALDAPRGDRARFRGGPAGPPGVVRSASGHASRRARARRRGAAGRSGSRPQVTSGRSAARRRRGRGGLAGRAGRPAPRRPWRAARGSPAAGAVGGAERAPEAHRRDPRAGRIGARAGEANGVARRCAARCTRRWRSAAAAWRCTTCAKRSRGRAAPCPSRSSPRCTSSATRRASSRWRPRTPGRAPATRGGATSSARRSTRSAAREKVTRRHAVMKRIAARWPDAARDLLAICGSLPRYAAAVRLREPGFAVGGLPAALDAACPPIGSAARTGCSAASPASRP